MATSSERTPPPFPEEDLDTETRDDESIENEYVVTREDVIEAETKTNSALDDISSELQTDNVSNQITDSKIKSDIDVIDKQGKQSVDMELKEESYQVPDSILSTLQNTPVSEPEDDGSTAPTDCTTVLSPDSPGLETELETVNDSANDMSHLTGEPTNDCQDSQDKPVVPVILEPKIAGSDPPYKTLGECELETDDDDPTNDLTRETKNNQFHEPVSDCQDIPVVDALKPRSVDSDLLGQTLAACELETDSDPTSDPSREIENDQLDDHVSYSQDIPVVDVLKPRSVDSDSPGQTSAECEIEADSDPKNDPSQEMDNDQLDEYASDSQDIPVVDVILEQRRAGSDSPEKKFGEIELKIENDPTNDLSQETENNQIGEPVSDCQDLPVGDVLFEPRGAVGEPVKCVNSFVCVKDPLSDIGEQPTSDTFSKLLGEPANKQTDLFSDQPEDLFSEMLNDKVEQKSYVFSASLTDTCLETKNTLIAGPLSDDMVKPPSDIFSEDRVVEATSPTANSDSSSESLKRDDDEQDIFAEASVELSLDSPAVERKKVATSKVLPLAASSSISEQRHKIVEEVEEEDKFELNVSVTNPEKVGDGINAYMAYRVSTQTTLPVFKSKSFVVRRRFSDFLGLYEKLSEKHSQNGYIVPPPPEKSFLGMTKMKVGKEDHSSAEFLEKRRAALERFIQRVLGHPSLLQDPDVREFLEREELPRAVNTQTLSGAGFLKIITRATDAVSKMTIKMNESDIWFEEKLQEVEGEDQQLRKLHIMVDLLANHRKDLSAHTAMFAKSIGMLGSSEDSTALSRALCQLAEVEEKIEQLHQQQAGNDFFNFAELLADYIRLLGSVRGCFDQRMKMWQRWQDAQNMLQKKREAEAKLLWANKPEKLQLAKDEITEWEAKVTQYERDFERISATVRKEVIWFEKEKAKDFKKQMLKYLQALLYSQQQLTQYWESFLPEAKAIN